MSEWFFCNGTKKCLPLPREVPFMSPSEQKVWFFSSITTMLREEGTFLNNDNTARIEHSLLPGSVLSILQGLSPRPILLPRLSVVPACNWHHELNILIWFVYGSWYSGNSPHFLASIMNIQQREYPCPWCFSTWTFSSWSGSSLPLVPSAIPAGPGALF